MKVKLKPDDNKILLSIGMIVKNEEKHLENCMKALMPLRQQIKSELIIVDTGSDDKTIEIAKKYADKFYEFEWCDDFAAARNYGLDRAVGKWFMFIDADEYFDEDISEIVNFFKYPEIYEKYNSAGFVIRSYYDKEKKNYSDFIANRIVKRVPGIKFEGAVHESLPMFLPYGNFDTIVHHYGYMYADEEEDRRKKERNLKLLYEEYKKNPNDAKLLSQLYDSSADENRERYLSEWYELCKTFKCDDFEEVVYRNHCYADYILYLAFYERYDEAINLYNEYIKLDGAEESICTIQIYTNIAAIYFLKNDFEKSYEIYLKYFELYKKYAAGKLDMIELRFKPLKGIQPLEYKDCVKEAVDCLVKLGRDKDVLKLLNELDVEHDEIFSLNEKNNAHENDGQILLSIGMIVKNEEKHLENCMKALMPLRQQVKSELIIVDTGSTDRTIEIAKKYADKFYEFEWCNDFAAARNYGLERAVGKWFMFLDADEYFDEDVSEIVGFFKYPELYEKYNSASYVIRNYEDETRKYYADFFGSRMVKRTPEIRFKDPIHEWIPMNTPHGYFETVVHHFGYAYKNNNKLKKAKDERNLAPMFEEYEKNPENVRTVFHIACGIDPEKKEYYLDKCIELCRKGLGGNYRNQCYVESIRSSAWLKKFDKCEQLYNEYMDGDDMENSVSTVSVYVLMSLIYYDNKNFEKAYEFYGKYFDIYARYKRNELNMRDLNSGAIKGVTPSEYKEHMLNYVDCLFKLGHDEDAVKLLDENIDIDKIDFVQYAKYSTVMAELSTEPSKHKYIVDFYKKVLKNGDPDRLSIISKLLEEYYFKNPDIRLSLAEAMAEIDSDDPFVSIMKIAAEKDEAAAEQKIYNLVNSIEDWNGGYSELIYLAMKHKTDIFAAVPKMSYEQTREFLRLAAAYHHDDYAEVVLEYSQEYDFTGSIKQLFWIVSALETAVLEANELEDAQKHDLYHTFIAFLSDYVLNIYNPELFNAEDAEIMPPLHRFGYYMGNAVMALNEGDKIGYIRNIKEALRKSEPMKDVVAFLLAEFEAELK